MPPHRADPVKKQIIESLGPVVHEYYAGTEGNGFVYCNSEMWLAHEGTVGMPIACTLHIVDDEGNELPPYESGTIYFEGGATFEYHNDPDKTTSRATRRAGRRSATSGTSTRRSPCT